MHKKQFKKKKKSKQVSAHALTHHFPKQVKYIKTKHSLTLKKKKRKKQTGQCTYTDQQQPVKANNKSP
jgi:hypothetical protein